MSNHSTVTECFTHRVLNPPANLRFTLTVKTTSLVGRPYSIYQQKLATQIICLREEKGMTFPDIADWLNKKTYTTQRNDFHQSSRTFHLHKVLQETGTIRANLLLSSQWHLSPLQQECGLGCEKFSFDRSTYPTVSFSFFSKTIREVTNGRF